MNFPLKLDVPERLFRARKQFTAGTARYRYMRRNLKMFCGLLAMTWPLAAAFAQSSSSSPQSSSQQSSSTQAQPPSQAQPANPDQPPKKEDSLTEAERKAKAKKAAAAKAKVYTEDDLSGLKGPGVSVVGDAPKKGARRARPTDPGGDGGENSEEYWRGRARQILDAIAQTDEQITQKREEIKKFGSGGFDVTTGMKDNIAYINDRNGQLKDLEKRKADLEKQLDELQDEGRKAGASPAWFR
jgi:DNA repair exonuclease SbcCD ATPase subunit